MACCLRWQAPSIGALPDLDSPATSAALLDRGRGGSFRIAPDGDWLILATATLIAR